METESAPKVGRPSKYDPAFCEKVVELGREGMGRAEIAYHLDVDPKTLDNWAEAHPEFFHAYTRARSLSEGWWEREGRLGIKDRQFNAQAYRLQVMNRFPGSWRDKQSLEHTGADGGPVAVSVTRRVVGVGDEP